MGNLPTAYATCKTDPCRRTVAWKSGYTAVVLDENVSSADYHAALDAITRNGGVVAIEAERVILGWVPQSTAGKLRQTRGVNAVLYDRVGRPSDLASRPAALSALGFFNDVQTGAYEDTIEKSLAAPGLPLTGDTRPHPGSTSTQAGTSFVTSPESIGTRSSDDRQAPAELTDEKGALCADARIDVRPDSYANESLTYDMRGRVTVQLFRMDSDGTVDSNVYSWTSADMTTAYNQAMGAFTFWVSQASARGITLSFSPVFKDPISRYTRTWAPTSTRYEPINRSTLDNYLWVNDALAYVGYAATTVDQAHVWTQVDAYCQAQMNDPYAGTYDRSFAVFIVNNQGDPRNGTFADGKRPFTYRGGPYTVMASNSAGWGLNGLGIVLTHETGHIFWACDEYAGECPNACAYCETWSGAPRSTVNNPYITNSNCGDPQYTCGVSVDCVMKNSIATLCPYTPAQIGW